MNIRKLWIDFFESNKHLYIEPKSLVPVNDPSLLWINSGVATIKTYFDGSETPPSKRMVNVQRAIRTNDIENIGVTARHHTLFEMLGNFSIGDYFKKEAIAFAWEFLTSKKYMNLDTDKLFVTVYSEDKEAMDIWTKDIGLDKSKIIIGDKKTNFWDLGKGPCGPCSEIFYDRGSKFDPSNRGIELLEKDEENDRYIEIWNIVFSQFNNDGEGNYTDLVTKNIDTGMGFERMVAIIEDGVTNFDTSLFMPIINEISKHTKTKYIKNAMPESKEYETNKGFKVIADHFKANIFAMADGAFPDNKDRGYVLRMILRRSFYFMKKMNIESNAIDKIVDSIINNYNDFYTNLNEHVEVIKKTLNDEYKAYEKVLVNGKKHFDKMLNKNKTITPKDVFYLYETFGLPPIASKTFAEEHGIEIDDLEVENVIEKAREETRKKQNKGSGMAVQENIFDKEYQQTFVGYETTLIDSNVVFKAQASNGNWALILDKNPFYSESGGQVSDTGKIDSQNVIKVDKNKFGNTVLYVENEPQDAVRAVVTKDFRDDVIKHHSSIHLLHKALNVVLEGQIKQAGSNLNQEKLRFDYNGKTLTNEQIEQVEKIMEHYISEGGKVISELMTLKEAKEAGAVALFEDKYGDQVRVVTIADTKELCGGIHVDNVKDIEDFAIVSVEQKSATTARINAICGTKNINLFFDQTLEKNAKDINALKSKIELFEANKIEAKLVKETMDFDSLREQRHGFKKIRPMIEEARKLVKEMDKNLKKKSEKITLDKYGDLTSVVKTVGKVNLALIKDSLFNTKVLSQLTSMNGSIDNLVIIAIAENDNMSPLGISVSKSAIEIIKAGDIAKVFTETCGGKAGGSPVFAQGAIQDHNKSDEALTKLEKIING